jgi:putative endonuclease
MKELFVYILKCSDNSYYVGLANNVNKRFEEHQLGLHVHSYTYSRRHLELMWFNKFSSALEAIEWEKKIKGWTRKKKEALMNGNFELLNKLSDCKNETNFKNYVKQASTPLSLTVNK